MPTKDPIDFGQLADSYEIVGAVGAREDADVALATRKSDRLPALIVVSREPREDAGNALSHLASDSQLLSGSAHPAVVPVVESRWLGNDALAVVTERMSAPSLEERLSRREEVFPFPRIASVLREVNGALEWARERGVVHRAVRPDTVFIADGSDSVRVSFVARALPTNGTPDQSDDAQTIASLARAMMTRSVADPERDALPLADLRPGLPSRVVQQTEALMGRAESLEPVDVRAYISAIAMAEELRKGEEECERVTQEMSEEQRVTREQLAAERKAHEEDLAAQARTFAAEREQILKGMAKEREDAARAMSRERETGEKHLRKEREQLEKEIQKGRDQLAKERARLSRERKALESEQEKWRAIIDEKMAALAAQAELYGRTAELPTSLMQPVLAPAPVEIDDVDTGATDELVDEPDDLAVMPRTDEPAPRRTGAPWHARFSGDSRWRRGGYAALALLLLAVIGALALGRSGGERAPTATLAAETEPNLRVVDSFSGFAAPALDSLAPPVAVVEAEPVRPRSASARPRMAQRRDTVVPRRTADTIVPVADPFSPPVPPPSVPPPAVAPLPFTRPESLIRRDTSVRRDTLVRRDTVMPRPDTMPTTLPDSVGLREARP